MIREYLMQSMSYSITDHESYLYETNTNWIAFRFRANYLSFIVLDMNDFLDNQKDEFS